MKVSVILLNYEEPGVTEKTVKCLKAAGITNVVGVGRDGVGSMSKAFNQTITGGYADAEYCWFLTDVTFDPEVPAELVKAMDADERAAIIHPAFDSDHPFMQQLGIVQVPFVEWTAPMIRMSALEEIGLLDDYMGYDLFDLEWCYRAKQKGWHCLLHGDVEVDHVYLRNLEDHPVSKARAILRKYHLDKSMAHMEQNYGKNWMNDLYPTHWDTINKLINT